MLRWFRTRLRVHTTDAHRLWCRVTGVGVSPLAFLALGQSDAYPSYFRMTGERRDSFIDVEETEHPLNLGNGRFDLAYFVAASHSRSRCQSCRSAASRSNSAPVLTRTSVNGRPVRRVTWVTGRLWASIA
jgi:hypothetical protein